jgi:hypothetical protein
MGVDAQTGRCALSVARAVGACVDQHAGCLVGFSVESATASCTLVIALRVGRSAASGSAGNAAGRCGPAFTTPAQPASLRPQATRCRS